MFGHDTNEDNNNAAAVQPMSTPPVNNGLLGIDDDDASNSSPSNNPQPASPPPAPSAPGFDTPVSGPLPGDLNVTPDANQPVTQAVSPTSPDDTNDDALLNIKRDALQELSPLINHLDQDPEEKFRTTMMMIQASDNKDLLPQAFTAAKTITDDKKRAQALLDIVNEINYFTHKDSK